MEKEQKIIATGFLLNDAKVLLARRGKHETYFPGVYEMPGGKVDFGEQPVAGLIREYKEEVNLDIDVIEPFYTFSYLSYEGQRHNIEIVYLCKLLPDSAELILGKDHDDAKWCTLEEAKAIRDDDILTKIIIEGFKRYLK
jgi:8-oxo-dGTP diphosphatase